MPKFTHLMVEALEGILKKLQKDLKNKALILGPLVNYLGTIKI